MKDKLSKLLTCLLIFLSLVLVVVLLYVSEQANRDILADIKSTEPYIVGQYKLGSAARPTVHRIWYYPSLDIYSVEHIPGGSQ